MLHDDDRIDPSLLETCVDVLGTSTEVGYIRTGNRLIDGDGDVIREYPNGAAGTTGVEALQAWMRCQNYWALSSTLYETAALRRIGGFPTATFPLTFDCHATANIALHGGGIELEPTKACFRIHNGELSHKMAPEKWIAEWQRLFDTILSWAPTEADRETLRTEGRLFFSMLCYQFAAKVRGRLPRLAAHLSIYARFRHVSPSVRHTLAGWKSYASPFGREQKVRS